MFEVSVSEFPTIKDPGVAFERGRVLVVDCGVPSHGDIELASLVESAKTVEPCPVQVVEQLGPIGRECLSFARECVETIPQRIVRLLVVAHLERDLQSITELAVEVDHVRIGVIEERMLWAKSEGDCKSAHEGLNKPAVGFRLPQPFEMRQQPPLAAGPLEGRRDRCAPLYRTKGTPHPDPPTSQALFHR